eukprot:jgi/Mesvir1/12145/Mv26301-RA.1
MLVVCSQFLRGVVKTVCPLRTVTRAASFGFPRVVVQLRMRPVGKQSSIMRFMRLEVNPPKRSRIELPSNGPGESPEQNEANDAACQPTSVARGDVLFRREDSTAQGASLHGDLSEEQRIVADKNRFIALAKCRMREAQKVVDDARAGGCYPALASLLVEPTWRSALASEFEKPYMEGLYNFVKAESAGSTPIYPPTAMIFRALNTCPLDRVKVVLLGQDPYHDVGQAMGLCFSVPEGVPPPPSLVNIFKELEDDLGPGVRSPSAKPSGDLHKWATEGVLLLNTVLTVRAHQANSHAKRGWELFTDAVIRAISLNCRGVVFLLWGKPAQLKSRMIDAHKHHILAAPHPSPLSCYRGFYGSKPFSKANELLVKSGKTPVDWHL